MQLTKSEWHYKEKGKITDKWKEEARLGDSEDSLLAILQKACSSETEAPGRGEKDADSSDMYPCALK